MDFWKNIYDTTISSDENINYEILPFNYSLLQNSKQATQIIQQGHEAWKTIITEK